MTLSLSDVVRTTFLGGLGELGALLDAAQALAGETSVDVAELLEARLADDMFTFAKQIQSATDTARRVTDRLAGTEASSRPDPEPTLAGLKARIDETIAHVRAADAAAVDASVDRAMKIDLGAGEMDFTGRSYALGFALPNFTFHVVTAYGILRHRGAPLGKVGFITPYMRAVLG